ncbi:MAG: ATP cone domain-containing protein [Fimbriimonadaceae bacterium]
MRKPTVYLAGPISACNPEQRHAWRNELKRGFSEEFEFIDPTDKLIAPDGSDFEVVQADADAIRNADAVLANMWRESIGTSFGVLHAHMAGKIVAVCDSNLIQSRMLAFYADAVERTLPAALHAIRTFLRAQSLIKAVQKQSGVQEPFDRGKLSQSVRKACLAAGTGDVVPTRAIVTQTLSLLFDDVVDERVLTTAQIKEAVWEALATLGADPLHETDYDAVRRAWEEYREGGRRPSVVKSQAMLPRPTVHDAPLVIRRVSRHNHSTIWGAKIGLEAARIFDEIARVDGITEIVFGEFKNTGSPPSRPHVRLKASKTGNIIEGICYDKGKKGTQQTFQVRVANPAARDLVLDVLREHLEACGHIRPSTPGVA